MRDKKGQFYLITAVILVTIILGFVAISNYSKKKTSVKIYDLGEELGIESQNVLDYGTYTGNDKLRDFIGEYSSYIGSEAEIYIITGDENDIHVYKYTEGVEEEIEDYENEGGKVIIQINDIDYQFKLTAGENFYFIILQEIDGEKYVVTG